MSIAPLLPPEGDGAAGVEIDLTGESDLASLSPEQLLAVAGVAMNDAEAGVARLSRASGTACRPVAELGAAAAATVA